MFYKIVNNELANNWVTGETPLGTSEPLGTALSSTHQYPTWFCVCFCLKTPCFTYFVDSLMLDSQPTTLMPKWSLSNAHLFCVRHCTAFLHLLDRQNFRGKKVALNRSQQEACYTTRAKARRFHLIWEGTHGVTQNSHNPALVPKWLWMCWKYWPGGFQLSSSK